MSKVQTAVVFALAAVAVLVGGITLLARRRAAHRVDLLHNKARDMRERMDSDRLEVARRVAAARAGARASATAGEVEEPAPGREPAAVSSSPADQADLAERLRTADEDDPELPQRVVAERDRDEP